MKCCICHTEGLTEDAPILTHGAYGHARCLCPSCAEILDRVTTSCEAEELRASLRALTDLRLSNGDLDRPCCVTLNAITRQASGRLAALLDGTYQPSDTIEEGDGELPEELLETEEDRELDRRDDEREARLDRGFNYVWIAVLVLVLGVCAYLLFLR